MEIKPRYVLAETTGYYFNIANKGRIPYDEKTYRQKENFEDIVIERPGYPTYMQDLTDYALVTINGYVHPTEYVDGHLYVDRAVEPMLKTAGRNHVGIIDFSELDDPLEKIFLKDVKITEVKGHTLYEKCRITFDKELDGIILIMAGYLILEDDDALKRVSDKAYEFSLEKFQLVDKIYELARNYNIFEELGVDTSDVDKNLYVYEQLVSDEVIRRFLTRFNSFMVNIPGKAITHKKIFVERSPIPTHFRCLEMPVYPAIGGQGKIIEYKRMKTNNYTYTLFTIDAFYNNLMWSYTPPGVPTLVNAHRRIRNTYDVSALYLLELTIKDA